MELFVIPKLNVPFPVIAAVTSSSSQVFSTADPAELNGLPDIAGALFQFNPPSTHGVLVL